MPPWADRSLRPSTPCRRRVPSVADLRKDPLTGRWVVIAEGRSARPNEYAAPVPLSSAADCPFCEGHESQTPPEVAAVRREGTPADGPGWRVRTIPNRFPTLAPTAPRRIRGVTPEFFAARPGYGYHEVIIESPQHEPALPFLPPDLARDAVRMYRDRVAALASRPSVRSVVLFENYGPESGGTLMHPHAQVVATPVVPSVLADEAAATQRFARNHPGGCLLETVAKEEQKQRKRVVFDDGVFLAVAPFASVHPDEILIIPWRHAPSIADATSTELARLAEILPALLRAEFTIQPSLSYNFFMHFAPLVPRSSARFHWHIEIVPRLVRPDGFDIGSGIPVNPVPPEVAAPALREGLSRVASEAPPVNVGRA